jgi:predicted dehydrogenase/threonine dehydrogenase-like Zn-dependent dehydrogenase
MKFGRVPTTESTFRAAGMSGAMIAAGVWLTCRAMKQVVLRGGQPIVADHPAPGPQPGSVLVANAASVISSGTERTAMESGGGGSLPVRAIRNPELVTTALRHMREHGVRETLDVARGTTAPDNPLGYSSAGTVLDTGGVPQLRVGQRVACAGAGRANHAEVVSVPANLVVAVPDGVPLEQAAFTTLGAIAMQGVRRAEPTLGERVVVVGLGLLGLLTVQILCACGCRVLGVEPVDARRRLAVELGAESAVPPEEAAAAVSAWTDGIGADAVVITASSASDAVVNSGIELLRRKGRLVPVGDVGLGLDRPPLYLREADVLISTSYGPGRYDTTYEEQGVDYPIEYVRWTENRNMEAFLHLLSTGAVRVQPLAGMTTPVERVAEAYEAIAGDSPPLAAVLTYSGATQESPEVVRASPPAAARAPSDLNVALVGAGGFVANVHVPNLKAARDVRVKTVVTRSGTSAGDVARLVGGAETATDWRVAIDDPDIDLVLIGTRHDTHAEIAAAALRAGKAVFVEKPLGLTREQIDYVWEAGRDNARLAIGFNRPFAPLARVLGDEVADVRGPLQLVYRVSSPLPHDHWLNDPVEGGGRLLGEGCHMLDFANWLCGVPALVYAAGLPAPTDLRMAESTSVTVQYENGSVATVHYSGVGDPSLSKERVEVLGSGRAWVLDDFATLTSHTGGSVQTRSERRADKGHSALLDGVLAAVRGERPFEPGLGAAYAAQSVALGALESLATGSSVEVKLPAARC